MIDVIIAILVLSTFPVSLVLAAISDFFTMTIPNRISIAVFLAFLLLAPLVGFNWAYIGMSLVAGLVVFAICFGLFALNVMGGGDAKLLTASALWFGFNYSLLSFLATVCLVGGLVTLFFLVFRWQSSTVLSLGIRLPASLVTAKKIPYGIAIAIGGFLTFEQAPIYGLAIQAFR